jgi:hypothetical protein
MASIDIQFFAQAREAELRLSRLRALVSVTSARLTMSAQGVRRSPEAGEWAAS